ncbi:unnamed protein product [Dibothriocephalus latus]|uniref:Uncharacterized protein n=1 Tax=Dibothriocephalus latus TaxID=60516 RepID=A0A3P7QNL0_DIBLA|nr:unnamed protein product [Dibothriocephalus latus]
MTLNVGKRACLEEWAGRVLKKDVSLIDIKNWSLYFELLDKAFERRPKGTFENNAESVIDRLNVGLRVNPKVFMDAAFKLPPSLHVDVVQMVKPLIEGNSVSLSSFDTLLSFPASLSSPECTRFDQLPSFPLTCPPASRPDRLSDLSTNKFDENSQPALSDSLPGFVTPFHRTLPSSVTKMRRYMTPDNIKLGAEFTSNGSPLCSLQNILESPQMAQKNLLVSKLDEIRSLKLKLAEQRDLCEELQNDNCRLEKSAVDSDRRIAELELRVRAKETELTDLRDEAEEAKFLRTEKENLEHQNSR